jgi:uncharacterized protein YlzI (FlbEa/FlbD family)
MNQMIGLIEYDSEELIFINSTTISSLREIKLGDKLKFTKITLISGEQYLVLDSTMMILEKMGQ